VTGPATQGGAGVSSTGNLEGPEIFFDKPSEARKVLEMPTPVIPESVSKEGRRLKVVVAFVLTPQGVLEDLRVKQGSGHSELDKAVEDALRHWRFVAVSGGGNVTGRVTFVIVPR
jgi:TonB family protein